MNKKVLRSVVGIGIVFGAIFLWKQYTFLVSEPFALVDVEQQGYDTFYSSNTQQYTVPLSAADTTLLKSILPTSKVSSWTTDFEQIQELATILRWLFIHSNEDKIRHYNFHAIEDVTQANWQFPTDSAWYAKFFTLLAQTHWYPTRVVWMIWHVANELYLPDIQKWVYIDVNKNLYLTSFTGSLLNLWDILDKRIAFQKQQLTTHSSWDDDFSSNTGHTDFLLSRTQIMSLNGADLIEYPYRAADIKKVAMAYLVQDYLGKWQQLSLSWSNSLWNKDLLCQIKFILP